jgi:hypothetical protein
VIALLYPDWWAHDGVAALHAIAQSLFLWMQRHVTSEIPSVTWSVVKVDAL